MLTKDMKKLGRAELIDVIYQLKKSEQELQAQVQSLQTALQDRKLKMEQIGSVAEASLALTDIFQNAQEAADTYLNEIKRRHAAVEQQCDQLLAEAQQKADAIVADAIRQRDAIMQQCQVSRSELRRVNQVLQSLNDELPFEP